MTFTVIDEALSSTPPEFQPLAVDAMRAKLIARRAQLPAIAEDFYEWLATDVDVRGTDEDNFALVERLEDGTVRVRLSQRGESGVAGTDGGSVTDRKSVV